MVPPTPPVAFWVPDSYHPDTDLRIQALGHLIRTDAKKVIPILKEMAFEAGSPGSASRAVFVLAQSQSPEARETVVQVALTGPPPVRVAAARELARFGGPDASKELMQVYTVGDVAVKRQIVRSFGERWERLPLLTIARSETSLDLKSRAIMMLGRAGGSSELRMLYSKAGADIKRPIILSLFNARAEDELIQIAERERDRTLRQAILNQLRLLGTPKAKAYLQKIGQNR
jgi:HEAT repeat protein